LRDSSPSAIEEAERGEQWEWQRGGRGTASIIGGRRALGIARGGGAGGGGIGRRGARGEMGGWRQGTDWVMEVGGGLEPEEEDDRDGLRIWANTRQVAC
jgi:hypothetical protein